MYELSILTTILTLLHMGPGRPLKFKSAEDLQMAIDAYFSECDARTKKELVKYKDYTELVDVPNPKPYTVEGLASHLGVDRGTLINYSKREDFFHTIARAKEKILANLIERGLDKSNDGGMTKFNLINNYGFRDKHEDENKEITVRIIDETEGDSVSDDFYDDIDFDDD